MIQAIGLYIARMGGKRTQSFIQGNVSVVDPEVYMGINRGWMGRIKVAPIWNFGFRNRLRISWPSKKYLSKDTLQHGVICLQLWNTQIQKQSFIRTGPTWITHNEITRSRLAIMKLIVNMSANFVRFRKNVDEDKVWYIITVWFLLGENLPHI
jgi:hypothetical protein